MPPVTFILPGPPHPNPDIFMFYPPYYVLEALKTRLRTTTNDWIAKASPDTIMRLHCHANFAFDFACFTIDKDEDFDCVNGPFLKQMMKNLTKMSDAVTVTRMDHAPLTEARSQRTLVCCGTILSSLRERQEQRRGGASVDNGMVSKRLHITMAAFNTIPSTAIARVSPYSLLYYQRPVLVLNRLKECSNGFLRCPSR